MVEDSEAGRGAASQGGSRGRRLFALWLLVQVLLGTLLPAAQAQPLWNSIFEVLDARACADPGDDRAPVPRPEASHCILCFGAAKTGLAEVSLPALPPPAVQPSPTADLPTADAAPRRLLREGHGCRGPPSGSASNSARINNG